MITLKIKSGQTLSYDEENETLLVDGKLDKNWKASFIPSGDDTPDFFGFVDMKNKRIHDIYGNESKISFDEDIKL